ncbi:unnamed protein product [Cyprideis torosa]|uniref:5'-nucleotidase n=1 Tax=Cyprideis torosa TaxID=163714 RepID=A0A7R8ZLL7_9CRUS|nr:unnamed protein product [Cyprideis torosa]CAG0883993.1 unnamed protein product [Cyprideis torosa]
MNGDLNLEALNLLPEELLSRMRMRDPVSVDEHLGELIKGGRESLQVVADWDNTLSAYRHEGVRCPSSFGVIDHSRRNTEKTREHAKFLFNKYYPIEVCPVTPKQVKIPLMKEWYSHVYSLYAGSPITKDQLSEIVLEENAFPRIGAESLLDLLDQNDVPVLIFSAGLGDVIEAIIQVRIENMCLRRRLKNLTLISNFLEFDSRGVITGLKGGQELIHMYNKSVHSMAHEDAYFNRHPHRHNILVLGDSPGDSEMAEGIPKVNGILKIGFLNANVQGRLEEFLDLFDIVLCEDDTMDVPLAILGLILGSEDRRKVDDDKL